MSAADRDVAYVALVRRGGRLLRSVNLLEATAAKTVRAARADGLPAALVAVRLVPLDGGPLDGRLPEDGEEGPLREVTARTRKKRERRLGRLVEAGDDVVDLSAWDG